MEFLLGTDPNWGQTTFTVSSVWGNDNGGKDLWGWGSPCGVTCSAPFKKEDGSWYTTVTFDAPQPQKGEELALVSRYIKTIGGTQTNGVISGMLPEPTA